MIESYGCGRFVHSLFDYRSIVYPCAEGCNGFPRYFILGGFQMDYKENLIAMNNSLCDIKTSINNLHVLLACEPGTNAARN